MDPRLKAIESMRRLADQYVAGKIGFADFFSGMQGLLGEHFDPLDWAIEGLPDDAKAAVHFFSEWTGGEFGETEERVPRDPNWRYGVDTNMFAWVDQSRYRHDFAVAYQGMQKGGKDGAV